MNFRFDKLTIKAQEAVAGAQNLATERQHPEIDPLHLLAAMISEREGVFRPLMEKIGVNVGQLERQVEAELARLPKVSGGAIRQPNAALREVLEQSAQIATNMKDEFVATEHLLLAIVKLKSTAKNMLTVNGVREQDLLTALQSVRGSQRVTDQNAESKYQSLEKYGIDLVERASQGKLDPVIGRDQEIRRVIQVLSRRTKNNAQGEPFGDRRLAHARLAN